MKVVLLNKGAVCKTFLIGLYKVIILFIIIIFFWFSTEPNIIITNYLAFFDKFYQDLFEKFVDLSLSFNLVCLNAFLD